jgi:peptide/nickel transport system substrate-binding protein
MIFRICAVAVALSSLVACADTTPRGGTAGGGTVIIAATSDPDALFPPLSLNMEARQATELIYEYLADVGVNMNTIGDEGFVKQLASEWRWSDDSTSIAFQIDPAAKWHDGKRVTAADVAFSFDVYTDPVVASPVATALLDIDSVSARDSTTAVVWFNRRTPQQFYDAAAQMLILPKHLLDAFPRDSLRGLAATAIPVGSGRYRLENWNRGSSFELRAVDDHYRGAATIARIIWTITPEYQAAVTRLLGGEADVFSPIRQETIPTIAKNAAFNLTSLPGMDYVFLQFNFNDPAAKTRPHRLFASRDMRRALTMALDRKAMVLNLFDTLASVSIGPTVRAFPTTDTTLAQIPYDPARAEQMLDSLGWRRAGAGSTRARNGVPLKFKVIVPVSSQSRMRMAVLIQEQLRRVGVEMEIDQMDYSAFSARQSARSFDAALAAWHLGSSPSAIRHTWTSAAAEPGGLNYSGYRSPVFDALVDSALRTHSLVSSKDYFRRANQTIVDDAPAVWLYEPRTILAVNERVRTTPMRPNAWWLDIARWVIPVGERIPRDEPVTGN